MSDLPAIPCERCGHRGEPDLEVVHLTPTTDEHTYRCARCKFAIVTMVLGDANEVDRRGAQLGGWGVEVDFDQEGRVRGARDPRKL